MDEEAYGRGEISICAFCREPIATTDEGETERIKKMAESGNAMAIYNIGMYYYEGSFGFPQDYEKVNEMWLKAGELGCAVAYNNLGSLYNFGRGVEADKNEAKYYWGLAAMNRNLEARYNLACLEANAGNVHRAKKHFILSARAGDKDSLDKVKTGFLTGVVTKDEYANALRAYQKIQDDVKSDDRDKAEEFDRRRDNGAT